MKSVLKWFALILCFTFAFALMPSDVSAAENFTISHISVDSFVYKGGTFDIEISTTATNPVYQWQVSYDNGSWKNLSNGDSEMGEYKGIHTPHFQLVTRIAMSAAIAATCCLKKTEISGAEAVNKSYPLFWEDYHTLTNKEEEK